MLAQLNGFVIRIRASAKDREVGPSFSRRTIGAVYAEHFVVAPTAAEHHAQSGRKRFENELVDLLLEFKWWDRDIEEINALIPLLTCSDLEKVKRELRVRL